ncbi:hypothetical protein AB0P36_29780 [Streptomyces flavidovirens]|uniref:hypothetical protein n=1 Tax=Streptomyces flavidovirens TaxID=67298 RepID=UPI00343C1486
MAARVASHPEFPLAALADELADASSRLDVLDADGMTVSLRTVLATSLRALSSSAGRLFALLGLVTSTDIGLDAATSLAGITRSRARTLLAELEAAHLVQQHRPARYRMHDLAQLYAGELAALDRAQQNAAARARLIDFYLTPRSQPTCSSTAPTPPSGPIRSHRPRGARPSRPRTPRTPCGGSPRSTPASSLPRNQP